MRHPERSRSAAAAKSASRLSSVTPGASLSWRSRSDASSERAATSRTNLTFSHRRSLGRRGSFPPARYAVALVACLAAASLAGGGRASASARSLIEGEPQPELASFNLGASGGGAGSGAVLSDGSVVLASLSADSATAVVCRLLPGARRCVSTATLSAYAGNGNRDGFFGVPEVLAIGGTDVAVVLEDCCYVPAFGGFGGAVVFESTNDGATFSGEVPAGIIQNVSAATVADGQIVVASSDTSSLNVQALGWPAHIALSPPANPNLRHDGNTSLSTYDGGVLVASDDASGNTLVEYAPKGSNFNRSSSYRSPVGIFHGEDLAGVSSNALLTYSSTSNPGAFLRFFNGRSFGPRYKVPEPAGAVDDYWSLQDASGVAHVFFLDRSAGSEMCSEATRSGLHWSSIATYNPMASAGGLVPALGPSGTGFVYETDVVSPPDLAQPILGYQSVVIELGRHRAPLGKRTYLTGQAAAHLPGQVVTLERRVSTGVWSTISVTRESSRGRFAFTVPGITDAYRVVVAYEPGYLLYGYSNVVILTTVPVPKPKR